MGWRRPAVVFQMHSGDNCWHCYRLHYPRRPVQYIISFKPARSEATWRFVLSVVSVSVRALNGLSYLHHRRDVIGLCLVHGRPSIWNWYVEVLRWARDVRGSACSYGCTFFLVCYALRRLCRHSLTRQHMEMTGLGCRPMLIRDNT